LKSNDTVNLVLKIGSGYRQVSARNLLNVITSSFIWISRVDSAVLQRCEECISNLADACWKIEEWIVAPLNANLSSKIYFFVLRSHKNQVVSHFALCDGSMCHSAQLAQDRDRYATKASSLAKENALLNDALLNATNQIQYLEQRLKSIEVENAMNQKTYD